MINDLVKLESLVKRYQTENPILFDTLSEFLSALRVTNKKVLELDAQPKSPFRSARAITTHELGDFADSLGNTWNVFGTAELILREYVVSSDDKFMVYTVRINDSTIDPGATPQWLSVALPPGWALRNDGQNNDMLYEGAGHSVNSVYGQEMLAVYCRDLGAPLINRRTVVLERANFAVFPANSILNVNFSITLPVEKVNYTPGGYGAYPPER